ncbi:MAG: LacI family DNA-binding transcriptional regulator [Akkermansiaceae bacterium]|nr:LacI family DNA-binding transcriptional regulator [Akkermansiaceae bacterium]
MPLASTSPKAADAHRETVDRLVALGHRRIVHLSREERRKPTPGYLEKLFLDRLEHHGITTGDYNLPEWEESAEGLNALLESLFNYTAPTAMIIDGYVLYNAVRSYLGNHGILVPDQVSLVCSEYDPSFDWCLPKVAHLTWDSGPIIRRVVKWTDNMSRGREDHRKSSTKARLVLGDTIGPARK